MSEFTNLVETITGDLIDDQRFDRVRTVMVVLERSIDGEGSTIDIYSSDDRPWVQEKFLDEALDRLEVDRAESFERDDDD